MPVRGPGGLAVYRESIVGPFLPEGSLDNVVAASGLSWAGVRMKAQVAQCRATLGARESGADDWRGQPGPSHGP
eukprot:4496100-Alexandrium_andersonii.AAC.1